jgi:16S rRNA (uracil1498-N3)-methyltransferase
MRRYSWPDSIDEGKTELKIEGELFKHIFVVCRRSEGDHFELLQGDKAHLVQVLEVAKKSAVVSIKSSRKVSPLKKPYINLVLSFSNPKVIDRVLEKSVELGVKSFQLVSTKNSFLKDQKTLESKTERAEKIVKQAMQQSGRGEALDLKAPTSLSSFLEDYTKASNKVGFMFYEGETSLIDSSSSSESDPENIYVLIGSEGGFTPQEATLAQKSGFEVLSLGDQILRVETACVASISILKSSFGIW